MAVATDSRSLLEQVKSTRLAARWLAKMSTEAKNQALELVAQALEQNAEQILTANQADLAAAKEAQIAQPLIDRLKLSPAKLADMIAGVRDVAKLSDPVGQQQIHRELDQGLVLRRVSCPLGVVGIIFESRPDAVTQITALALKSGNGLILKGGSEAVRSCTALVQVIQQALVTSAIAPDIVQLLTTRNEIKEILTMDQQIDLIIPRGSNQFVRYIQGNTKIPVLGHADGICHLFVDASAEIEKTIAIAIDAKAGYPAACNAIETLLVHKDIAVAFLPQMVAAFKQAGVEVRGCNRTIDCVPNMGLIKATDADWDTEYSDLIISVRIVDSLLGAIDHINQYGSHHTEAIATTDPGNAQTFMSDVDAAGVYHNCSTRFADGFRYGFGAEVGISTAKMPPRGPVGLEGLITYKYQLVGDGHVVATYAGDRAKPFTHKDL
ncbi:glutamate-5-semialdehyde dehydrogenase [Thalassoporum mexicanum PCC 7367]|uniref:glutamate-5-semialdehyde dehydrogenase n=1 Tax=Thalassoporum mexicanum TaxID=3457544 RepID=UPI00029FD495|nr:glutamate-5-semialdehyde dehydrogenase [Pseudanabaena sp. PCC 7367]AFY70666.1 glutamate-5-semialdehyde dehydrogenase [Pseudanabaena sp. PCC 7367]